MEHLAALHVHGRMCTAETYLSHLPDGQGTTDERWAAAATHRLCLYFRLFVDLVGSDTRGVMGGVYGSRSPRIRSANH